MSRRQPVYQSEIAQMMYVHGEVTEPREDTTVVVEEIVRTQMIEIIVRAVQQATRRGSRFMVPEDVIFLIRHDRQKVNTLRTYLAFRDARKRQEGNDESVTAVAEMEDEGEAESSSSTVGRRKIKFSWDLINHYGSVLEDDDEDDDDEDQQLADDMQHARLREADEVTRKMTKEEYMYYSECRQASFVFKKAQRFRKWCEMGRYYENKPVGEINEILGFLGYEMVRKLTETALRVKREWDHTHHDDEREQREQRERDKRNFGLFAKPTNEQTPLHTVHIHEAFRRLQASAAAGREIGNFRGDLIRTSLAFYGKKGKDRREVPAQDASPVSRFFPPWTETPQVLTNDDEFKLFDSLATSYAPQSSIVTLRTPPPITFEIMTELVMDGKTITAIGVARPIARIPGLAVQPSLLWEIRSYDEVAQDHISWLLDSSAFDKCGLRFVGLDTEFDGPSLGLIQLATDTRCLLVVVPKRSKNAQKNLNVALDGLLQDPSVRKTGCELTKDALLLYSNFGHTLRGGIDITHLYSPTALESTNRDTKGLFTLFSDMYLPPGQPLRKDKATTISRWVGVKLTETQLSYGVLDAWVSYKVGVFDPDRIAQASVLDLTTINPVLLNVIADQNSAILAIEDMQQKQYDSKFSEVARRLDGKYDVRNTQFRNKLQFKDTVLFHFTCGQVLTGKVEFSRNGKTKTVTLDNPPKLQRDVIKITVVEQGRSRGPDCFMREAWLKLVLHGQLDTSIAPFFGALFLKQRLPLSLAAPSYDLSGHDLNPSQLKAVTTMLCAEKPLTLIHGPPGTGKTFAITAAVAASITSTEHHFYVLTCQTNAATRNLAVTLLKRGVSDFKIVVSDDFFVEWHEDQYKKISNYVILSSNTKTDDFGDAIGPRTVVLCSVSQLSNANIISVLKRRRVTHLVIDEASQICIANLQHILTLYQDSLKRLTFVGDPKQLAPFGNEQHPTVQSVYERLRSDVMLNVQYRMPCDLGAFISATVYSDQLVSFKRPREIATVALVDVANGMEQTRGTGITNPREADAVVQIIFNQFLHREFLVITPYNAQKELIANRLRDAIAKRRAQGKRDIELSVADERVHTVDTVQGQEADVIVFSAVRTIQPGFLSNKRRMNVALTRAKEHLVVLAHMALFRTGHGKKSLLGVFVREMEKVTPVVSSKQLAAVAGYQLEFHPKQKGASITTTPTTIASTGDAEKIKGKNWKKNRRRKEKKREQKAYAKSRGSGTDLAR
ncbi:hypothetical protein HDU88_004931 [Geranomyces variabilis]|nr:hypothetical protein HDU88_004931 [Geranomyces variabilis]